MESREHVKVLAMTTILRRLVLEILKIDQLENDVGNDKNDVLHTRKSISSNHEKII